MFNDSELLEDQIHVEIVNYTFAATLKKILLNVNLYFRSSNSDH